MYSLLKLDRSSPSSEPNGHLQGLNQTETRPSHRNRKIPTAQRNCFRVLVVQKSYSRVLISWNARASIRSIDNWEYTSCDETDSDVSDSDDSSHECSADELGENEFDDEVSDGEVSNDTEPELEVTADETEVEVDTTINRPKYKLEWKENAGKSLKRPYGSGSERTMKVDEDTNGSLSRRLQIPGILLISLSNNRALKSQ